MPAKPGKEQSLLRRFLSVYEGDSWADADCDWLDERLDGAVELVAVRKSDGMTLAIEHTLIQPYPREKEDFARFHAAFLRGEGDPSLIEPGAALYVNVPAGALQPGDDWNATAERVWDCIRRNKHTIPDEWSRLDCPISSGRTLTLQVNRVPMTDDPGLTLIRRYGDFDLAGTVGTALETKLPKLAATKAQRRMLVLERDQWQVDHGRIAAELDRRRQGCPLLRSVDEIWIAETHEAGRIVLFDHVRPEHKYAPIYTFVGERLISRHDR
jgi:hypothetical protein